MSFKYEQKAAEFAKSFGFDGVLPNDSFPGNRVKVFPNGSERYQAAFFYEDERDTPSLGWGVPFDNTAHCIIVDSDGARWEDGNKDGQHNYMA